MSNRRRLLVIGLDGATWDIIDPLLRGNALPAIASLVESGFHCPLASTLPYATFPAWSSFMTGANPGRHGMFDFTELVRGSYRIRFLNASHRRMPSLWSILGSSGLRVGVMGIPATYPPEKLNGFMISGFDSPVAGSIDASFVYPPGLYDTIRKICPDYAISYGLEHFMDEGWYEDTGRKLLKSIDVKSRAALHLYRTEPWDCFMLLLSETDTAAHHFWKFHDHSSPRYEQHAKLGPILSDVYCRADAVIGAFLDNLWENTTVVLVSDHGFGGAGVIAVSINRRLAEHGFLSRLPRSPVQRCVAAARKTALRFLPQSIQEAVFRSPLRGLAQRVESHSRFSGTDWPSTKAFSEELNYFPSIHINLQGREPCGTVAGSDYERVREEIIALMTGWKDLQGRSIVRRAWRREEVYRGPCAERAPDILLDMNTHGGYSYLCLSADHLPGDEAVAAFRPDELQGSRALSMSGSHRRDGVFLCAGSNVSRTGLMPEGASIQDVCPSALRFFGLPRNEEMDGSCIQGFPAAEAALSGPGPKRSQPAQDRPYTDEQERAVAERLRNLGYID